MISSNNVIFFAIIISIVVFFISIYKMYQKMVKKQENEPVLLRKPVDAKKSGHFTGNNLQVSQYGTGYTYLFWMNINDWNYRHNEWKHVLHKGDSEGKLCQPGVWLTPKVNNMCIRFLTNNHKGTLIKHKNKLYSSLTDRKIVDLFYKPVQYGATLGDIKKMADKSTSKFIVAVKKGSVLTDETVVVGSNILKNKIDDDKLISKSSAETMKDMEHLKNLDVYTFEYKNTTNLNPEFSDSIEDDSGVSVYVKNMPLKRWTHIGIVVNEQTVEIYVDGLLHSTTLLTNLIRENTGHLYLGQRGGFDGQLTQLRYFNKPLNHSSIIDITRKGPQPFMLPSADIKFRVSLSGLNDCDKEKQD